MKEIFCLTYSDNGKGMSKEEQSNAAAPFYTTKRGQGLHLLYNLVTSGLGGSINVSSSPNKSTQFHIELPVNKPN